MTKQPFHELLERYIHATRMSTSDVNPETLEIAFPNGLSGGIARDMEQVLAVNDIEYGRFSIEQALQVGLVVGAALQRDGLVPERFMSAVDAIRSAET